MKTFKAFPSPVSGRTQECLISYQVGQFTVWSSWEPNGSVCRSSTQDLGACWETPWVRGVRFEFWLCHFTGRVTLNTLFIL